MNDFDPEGTFTDDSSVFGMPKEMPSKLSILPAAWEVTTSFRRGTVSAPEALLNATKQMDLYHPYWRKIYEKGVSWNDSLLAETKKMNKEASPYALNVIKAHESGSEVSQQDLERVNISSSKFNELIYEKSLSELEKDKVVGLVGGDHSTPYGLIKALSEKYDGDFSIVHLDAHFDLRDSYQGFKHSHASIMKNVMDLIKAPKLYQMGLRDFSESEFIKAQECSNFILDQEFHDQKLRGKSYETILDSFFKGLSEKVYISFDIDGLSPEFCPNTGTPVPGGFTYNEAVFLVHYLHKKGHQLIGFDLVEISPKDEDLLGLDEIIGSRLLYELSCFGLASS